MSDDNVWAEGLLVFYEIFKFLEEALASHSDSLIGDLLIPGMARTEALEADLAHDLADELDDDTKEAILVESVRVFEWNNVIIGSVKGVDSVLKRRLMKLLIAVLLLLLFLFAYVFHSMSGIEIEGDVFSLGSNPEL